MVPSIILSFFCRSYICLVKSRTVYFRHNCCISVHADRHFFSLEVRSSYLRSKIYFIETWLLFTFVSFGDVDCDGSSVSIWVERGSELRSTWEFNRIECLSCLSSPIGLNFRPELGGSSPWGVGGSVVVFMEFSSLWMMLSGNLIELRAVKLMLFEWNYELGSELKVCIFLWMSFFIYLLTRS